MLVASAFFYLYYQCAKEPSMQPVRGYQDFSFVFLNSSDYYEYNNAIITYFAWEYRLGSLKF